MFNYELISENFSASFSRKIILDSLSLVDGG